MARKVDQHSRRLALLLIAALTSCEKPAGTPEATRTNSEWRSFEGNWSAVGERHALHLGPNRRASVASLSGSLLLTAGPGLGVGFQAKAITFSDSLTGSLGRAVWTDQAGNEIFSELSGDPVATGRRIAGTIVGGTGRYFGVTGAYEMEWQFVIETEEGIVQGRAIGLRGRARFGGGSTLRPEGAVP